MSAPQTVVELAIFERQAKAIMSDGERAAIVDYVAANPDAGVPLGGACEKCAWPAKAAARAVDTGRSLFMAGSMYRCFWWVCSPKM